MSGPTISCRTAPTTGGSSGTLNIIDEFTREALVIRVDRKLNSIDVVDALTDLFILRGPPDSKVRQWRRIHRQEGARLD